MKSLSLDLLERQIIHALIIDGRAPFSRIAAAVGVSEQTVARRYRRMSAAAIVRVVGLPNSQRLGQSDWVVRLQCVPDAAAAVADALARRADTSWVSLTSGGTEIVGVVKPAEGRGRQDLLLRQLPSSRRIVAIGAQSLLHMFRGGTDHWAGATEALTDSQAAMLSPAPGGHASPHAAQGLGADDRALVHALARDGAAGRRRRRAGGALRDPVRRRDHGHEQPDGDSAVPG
jgi:DNA-binding Lrp family transcriptional regulator